MILRPLYIFDLDGTLSLTGHRQHLVEAKKWKEFYEACVHDQPNVLVLEVMERLLDSDADIWIFSGRNEDVRPQTEVWLQRYTSFKKEDLDRILTMRSSKDYTPDDVLKERWLHAMLEEDRNRLMGVFDDRDRVVSMWRANGVQCFQVAPGDF